MILSSLDILIMVNTIVIYVIYTIIIPIYMGINKKDLITVLIHLFLICVTEEDIDEFNIHVSRYRPEELTKLTKITKFNKKEIQLIYRGFKQVCSYDVKF